MRPTRRHAAAHRSATIGLRTLAAALAALLAGCAFSGERRAPLPESRYPRTFQAVQRVLVDHGFVLDRIDARAGVISTHPKASPGLFLPTDREQRSLGQEFRDAMHTHSRTVRVTMRTTPQDRTTPPPTRDQDPRAGVTVEVVLERASRPGFRIETEEIGVSSAFSSPEFEHLSGPVPVRRDTEFEAYLSRQIAAMIGSDSDPTGPPG